MARKQEKKNKGNWKQIGTSVEYKNNTFVSVDNQDYEKKNGEEHLAPGRILWEDFDTGKIYELDTIGLYPVADSAPKHMIENLSINLDNEKQCIDVSDEFTKKKQ